MDKVFGERRFSVTAPSIDVPLTRMPPTGPLSIRSRFLYMTEADWRGLAAALETEFPQARYHVRRQGPKCVADGLPKTEYYKHLFDAGGWLYDSTEMVFDPKWEPEYARYQPYSDKPEDLWWIILNHPRPSVVFRVAKPQDWEELANEPIHRRDRLGPDQIDFYADPREPEHTKLRSRVFRLIGKFAINRNQDLYRLPGQEFVRRIEKGSRDWVGHDAIRWALADPKRYFSYDSVWAFRPAAE